MKKLSFISQIVLIGVFVSCNGELGISGGGDDEVAPSYFVSFQIEGTDQDLFSLSSYSKDSMLQQTDADGDGTYGIPFLIASNENNNRTVLRLLIGTLSGGLGEPGTIGASTLFENNTRIFFSNGDIDTLYTVVRCTETCRYEDKIMQIYFNGKLIHDFDFRDKDSELLERLLDNNYEPYGDTVVFEIPKVPEF